MTQAKPISSLPLTLLRKILFIWVKSRTVPTDLQSLDIRPHQPICYVVLYPSLSDWLVIQKECLRQGLPSPPFLNTKTTALAPIHYIHLTKRNGRKEPLAWELLQQLIRQAQQDANFDVQIVPVTVFWGRARRREQGFLKTIFPDRVRANFLQKLFIIPVQGNQTFVQFSRAISLQKVLQAQQEQHLSAATAVHKLIRVLQVHFHHIRTALLGPKIPHRMQLIQSIISTENVQKAIQTTSKEKSISEQQAKKRALLYAKEIVSNYSNRVIQLFNLILTLVWNKIYKGIEVNFQTDLVHLAKDHTLVYIPCHRSHTDYLLLGYVLYYNGLSIPHVAAGINLNMPLVGPLLRRAGGFFMRRSFANNKLYTAVFNEYIYLLLSKGSSLKYYIEGTRSRTGRLLSPRTGILVMTIRAFLRSTKPIVFVPVYVSYEKLLENKTYQAELQGSTKKNESLMDIVQTLYQFRQHFGKVYVNFGNPIFLDQYLNAQVPHYQEQADKPEWLPKLANRLAHQLMLSINEVAAVHPVALMSLIILAIPHAPTRPQYSVARRDLIFITTLFLNLLQHRPTYTGISLPKMDVKAIIEYCEHMNIIHAKRLQRSATLDDIIYIESAHANELIYYRNNIAHLYTLPGLLASILCQHSRISIETLVSLTELIIPFLNAEWFTQTPKNEIPILINHYVQLFNTSDLVKLQANMISCPEPESIESLALNTLGLVMDASLKRFYIMAALLAQHPQGIRQPDLENKCITHAKHFALAYGAYAPDFADKHLFHTTIKKIRQLKLITANEHNLLIPNPSFSALVTQAPALTGKDTWDQITHIVSE